MERKDKHNEVFDPVASAESLTTSTESESFETWTLVTEGANKRATKTALNAENALDEEDRVELIEKHDNNKRENENLDDLSDGISIISDNESAGRASPHPLMVESSTDRSFPLITEISSTEYNVQNKEVQYEPLTPPASPKEIEAFSEIETFLGRTKIGQQSESSWEEIPRTFLGVGVKGIFYLSIFIALAAFIGKMKYPEWEQISLSSQISPLTQRIKDLELQNNLLRAEIDLLNKQVNYLSQQKDRLAQNPEFKGSYKQDGKRYENKNRENPKVWPGDGGMNLGETVEVFFKPSNKEHDKFRPNYETRPKEVPNNQHFDKERIDRRENVRNTGSKEYVEQRPVKEEKKYDREKNSYENHPKYPKSNYPSGDEKFENKHKKIDNGRNYEGEYRRKDQREYNSKESFQDDKYRKQKKREWENEYPQEQYPNNKRDKNWKHEDDWHEKMMQNREDARKRREQHESNNWYIERGSSRKEAREKVGE